MPETKIRLADYVFQTLVRHGIKQVFLVTGGGAMHLNDAIGRCEGLKPICCHHEQACAIAAEGYARVTDLPAIVNPTTGPGCLNALTGVFGAWTDSVPMIIISGQVKRETCMGFYEGTLLRQLGDQEIDIISIAKPITKSAVLLREPERVRYELERALYLASTGRPGPCWIDIPLDVQSALIEPESLEGFIVPADPSTQAASKLDGQIGEIIELLLSAKRPVILGGNGLRAGRARGEFQALLERLPIPVVASRSACDLLPSEHPLFMGRSGLDADRAGNFVLQSSDFLLVLGSRLGIRQMGYNMPLYAREATIAHVDIDPAELSKPTLVAKTNFKVQADLKVFLGKLIDRLSARRAEIPDWSEWTQWSKEIFRRYYGARPHHRQHASAINPYGFLEKLFEQLRDDDIIACGNGSAFIMTSHVARITGSQKMFFNSGCASMGYDLPAAIGAAIAGNGRRVICFAGEGSLQMNIQELQTVKHHHLNLILVVINNGGYLSIRTTQEGFFGFCFGESAETGVSFPDMTAVARAYGLPSLRISETNFEGKLKEALAQDGPLLLEVLVDPNQKFEPRIASKQLPSGKIVSPPLEDMFPHLSEEELTRCLKIPLAEME
ncbi:MAG: thiamine pyrophosphate-binding protein [Verrucomicrobiota bacterium]